MKNFNLDVDDLQLIDLALTEDLGKPFFDVTTALLFADVHGLSSAKIISKHPEPIIICGLPIVQAILRKISYTCTLETEYQDGQLLQSGETMLTIHGQAHELLMAERTILNFLQHLCAIATLTAKYIQLISDTPLTVLDTRKTLPGFRRLDKYAVSCGGGVNHRMGLYDAILVKDTHIDLLGGMAATLARLPKKSTHNYPVIVEVRTTHELTCLIGDGSDKVDRVLLDNMSPKLMAECVSMCQGIFPTEASGNISLDNIREIAASGVNFASIGKLTHSAGNVDLSMRCDL